VIEFMPSEPEPRREGEQLLALQVSLARHVNGSPGGLTLHLRDRLRKRPVHQHTDTCAVSRLPVTHSAMTHPRRHPGGYHIQQPIRTLTGVPLHVSSNPPKGSWSSPRKAKLPPVRKPEMIAFHGSSFCLYPFTAQSNVENSPPQTPKFPPRTGARALIADNEPTRRSPCCAKRMTRGGKGDR